MTEEMKVNRCKPVFLCRHTKENPCVYREHELNDACSYRGLGINNVYCLSTVAQVYALVIKLKESGITKGDWIDE